MCLYTKQICPLRARKDIVCYKKFYIWPSFLETIYIFYKIVKPTENNPTLIDDTSTRMSPRKCNTYPDGVRYRIYEGMIHAFKTKPACVGSKFGFPRRSLYKCIIPKGTLYYVGTDNDICAKKMLVIEEVNPNTAG